MLNEETKTLIIKAISSGSLARVDQILHSASAFSIEISVEPQQIEGLLAAAEILAGIRGEMNPAISTESIEIKRSGFERTSLNLERNAVRVVRSIIESDATSVEAKTWATSLLKRLENLLEAANS